MTALAAGRPLRFLAEQRNVSTTYVGCDGHGYVSPDEIHRAITPKTRLIALIHLSNVTGAIQPVEEVGRIASERNIFGGVLSLLEWALARVLT